MFDQCRSGGIYPASINGLYMARGRGEVPPTFTVPAINIRGMAYDTARALFRARKALDAGAVLLEIARSEMSYTDQRPAEYAFVMLAAALREGWKGPVFIQGDHFQINAKKYVADPAAEMQDRARPRRRRRSGRASTTSTWTPRRSWSSTSPRTPSSSGSTARCAREITAFIRSIEPTGVHRLGGRRDRRGRRQNSTAEELEAFVGVFNAELAKLAPGKAGMSKISIQTGTSHGGVPLPDGTIAKVKLDFDTLEKLSKLSREQVRLRRHRAARRLDAADRSCSASSRSAARARSTSRPSSRT